MTITVKPSQLRDLLVATIPARENVLITGQPGIGKTDNVTQACTVVGARLIVSHPVVSDPTDIKGLPCIVNGKATFEPFGDVLALITATELTCFLMDDLGQATPATQASYMQAMLAKAINGHKISDKVVFIACTNRRQDRAGVSGILEPVKSRFATIVELQTDLADWRTWAVSAGIRPEVIAFLSFRPELLSKFVPTADMVNSPCPRTWAAVSRLLNLNLPKPIQVPAFTGAVGEGAAVEFVAFLRIWQSMVSPDVVLTTPDTAPVPDEPSAMYALATAIADRVRAASMGRYCTYLVRLVKNGKGEFAAVSMKLALSRDASLASCADYVAAMSGPLGKLFIGS